MDRLKELGVEVRVFWNSTLVHREDLPFAGVEGIPDVFTSFRVEVEKHCRWRKPVPPPDRVPGLSGVVRGDWPKGELFGFGISLEDERSVLAGLVPGESGAWRRLDDYFWNAKNLGKYKETRNGMVGVNYSSKLSVWLAHGCISARCIAAEVERFEQEVMKNDSTYWLVFELLWRDFFRFTGCKNGARIFRRGGSRGKDLKMSKDADLFRAWCEGRTGYPMVDANMRELAATGFMSNRGRQNVASFLVRDLGLDWRLGAEWFEQNLVDYDVCSNWGNWNYAAGVGNDPREDRYFNVVGQGERYDSAGEYVGLWLPVLRGIAGIQRHQPWKVADSLRGGYPERVVELRGEKSPQIKGGGSQKGGGRGGGTGRDRGKR